MRSFVVSGSRRIGVSVSQRLCRNSVTPLLQYSLLFALLLIAPQAQSASITSNGSGGGNWSATATWTGGTLPTNADDVTILAGDTITIDISTATASTTTVNGTLQFSTVQSSSLTLVGGDITVASGGTLTLGTANAPIPSTVQSALILSSGTYAGQYGLIVANGGNLVVYGSTKTLGVNATGDALAGASAISLNTSELIGWTTGDVITIGGTSIPGIQTERLTLTGMSPSDLSWAPATLTYNHYSTWTVRVVNLTRNAVIRSSGTNVNTNTAYIQSLAKNTSSFSLTNGEFAYLGTSTSSKYGVDIESGKALISSSTIHDGFRGLYLNDSNGSSLLYSAVHGNTDTAVYLAGSTAQTFVINNDLYGNTSGRGIQDLGSGSSTIIGNYVYSNFFIGVISIINDTVYNNQVYCNLDDGMRLDQSLVAGNKAYRNLFVGLALGPNSNDSTLISNFSYDNPDGGLRFPSGSTSNMAVGDWYGYDASGNSYPNQSSELLPNGTGSRSLTLRNVRVNPSVGIHATEFNSSGEYYLSYNQDYATGTVLMQGHYTVSGSTFTLNYSTPLYLPSATTPKQMRGTSGNMTVVSVSSTAVSQLITLDYRAGAWHLDGSVSGADMITAFTGDLAAVPVPSNNPHFYLTYNVPSAPVSGERWDFVILAGSNDAAVQKKLKFGAVANALNSGKSKWIVAPNAGFMAVGVSTAPTLIDWMNSSATYYSFVSSGAFTVQYATFTNMDENGLRLSGSSGIHMNNVTFNYSGSGITSSSTYITADSLTSNATFSDLEFLKGRSSLNNYNVTVAGTDAGLSWTLQNYFGIWSGQNYEWNDSNDKVKWGYSRSSNGFWNVMD